MLLSFSMLVELGPTQYAVDVPHCTTSDAGSRDSFNNYHTVSKYLFQVQAVDNNKSLQLSHPLYRRIKMKFNTMSAHRYDHHSS
jgi:hypothetical protein